MAKRRKKSSKRERIPVVDFLIDMAAAATMDYIAYKRRQKRGGKQSNKIDPYEATGIAMGLGMIDDTEDLIKFGGMLGMMGAFDPDEPDEVFQSSYVGSHDDNPFCAPKNNKYAWRLNCEDGSEYGISPEDYETRDEYHEALRQEKYAWRDFCEDGAEFGIDPEDYETEGEYEEALEEAKCGIDSIDDDTSAYVSDDKFLQVSDGDSPENIDSISFAPSIEAKSVIDHTESMACDDQFEDDDFHVFVYCKVATNGGVDYYRTEDRSIKKGDNVMVPSVDGTVIGEVISVEHHMRFSVPKRIDATRVIISKSKSKERTNE